MLSKKKKSDKKELTLLEKMIDDAERAKNNKENLTLLERGLQEGNEFKKISRRKKAVPAKVDTEHKTDIEYTTPYDDRYEKYLHYAQKYGIAFSKSGNKKSYKDLAEDIHKYEMKNLKKILKSGMDKKYKEYGHYISVV